MVVVPKHVCVIVAVQLMKVQTDEILPHNIRILIKLNLALMQKRHWEAAYFVVVVPEHRCVIVAVRGTETPEDIITDALGRELELGEDDLGGLRP